MNKQINVGVIIYCQNNENAVEKSIQSVLDQDYPCTKIAIIDDSSEDKSWENICRFINRPYNVDEFIASNNINHVPINAVKHEFKTGLTGAMITGINNLWEDTDIFGLLLAPDEYLPAKLTCSVDYIKDIFDSVGVVYADYETKLNELPLKVYQESFSNGNINFGNCPLVTKQAMEAVRFTDQDELSNIWARINQRFVSIHIPEILSKETLNAQIRP